MKSISTRMDPRPVDPPLHCRTLFLALAALSSCHGAAPLSGRQRDAEEVAVYRAVLGTSVPIGKAQVFDGTAAVRPEALRVPKGTGEENEFDDFAARVSVATPLQTTAVLPAEWVVLPSTSIHDLFKTGAGNGWARFYPAYPDSRGIVTLSRVGFASNGLHAVVYVGNQRAPLAGEGALYVLRKVNGRWRVEAKHDLWIS